MKFQNLVPLMFLCILPPLWLLKNYVIFVTYPFSCSVWSNKLMIFLHFE